jgi:hypothetical protein
MRYQFHHVASGDGRQLTHPDRNSPRSTILALVLRLGMGDLVVAVVEPLRRPSCLVDFDALSRLRQTGEHLVKVLLGLLQNGGYFGPMLSPTKCFIYSLYAAGSRHIYTRPELICGCWSVNRATGASVVEAKARKPMWREALFLSCPLDIHIRTLCLKQV